MRRSAILFLFLLCAAFALKAQTAASRFLLYGVKDGLSQNSVHALFRGSDGLVWIGTQDGINSFDGKNFTVYRHDDDDSTTISDQFITAIKEDFAGNLWIGTRNGLNRFNKYTQQFTHYYISEEEKHNFQSEYTYFYPQKDGRILIKKETGIYILDPETGSINAVSNLPLTAVFYPGDNYDGWFYDQHHFYFCPDIRRKQSLSLGNGPLIADIDPALFQMKRGENNRLVFFSQGSDQIFIVNGSNGALIQKIISPAKIIDIFSKAGEIFICTSKGLFKANQTGDEILPITGLPPGAILSVFADDEQNIWAGTSTIGFGVNNKRFEYFRLVPPPAENDLISAFAVSGSTLFAGSRSGLYQSANFISAESAVSFKPIFTGKTVTALTADHQGRIWAAVQGEGISVYNNKGVVIKKIPASIDGIHYTVLSMSVSKSGQIMICTVNSFYLVDPLTFSIIPFASVDPVHPLTGNYVMSAFADNDSNIWIANNNGVDIYSAQLQKKFSFKSDDDKSSPIKRTIVTSVTQDKAGKIWIGTIRNGVYVYANNNFAHYTTSSGLASDVIYNVISDVRGRVWATTSAGLNVFDESKNAFVTLTTADGVPAAAYVFGAASMIGDALVLGTSEGLLFCNADKVNFRTNGINAYVADVKVNGQSISIEKNKFSIRADGKLVTFELAADPAFFYGNIIYQYRLKGAGNEWITLPRGIHTVSYNGLPYRELVMEVRAAGAENNLASAKISSVTINSKAPFWKTTAFIVAAGLLLISVFLLLMFEYNKRNYKAQLQHLQTEQGLQNERMRIGRDLHDNIGAYTSAMIAGLNHIKPTDDDQQQHIGDLKEYGANIMAFLRETIWMLNTETLTVTAFADRLKNYAIRIGKGYPETDFRFVEQIDNNKTLMPGIMLNLFRILQEALQNACKHADATAITITVKSKEQLSFELADNGKGFSPEKKEGHYGLENMKQRADEAGYTFTISSSENGSVISLTEKMA